ncbi:hypothetical protein BR93DRAFT_928984 [Coniochaeta sp. PMI_546]|nr:hypothetical protein BR93DRAFT_928984 [Coniochaeta sp. PMI_546]
MKVHSSIKKRCEHCKVISDTSLLDWQLNAGMELTSKTFLRSFAGKPTSGIGATYTLSARQTPDISRGRAHREGCDERPTVR